MAPTSPIHNLSDDALLTILDVITSKIPNRDVVALNRPLNIIRTASQVCCRWRQLLLASPWIWGRVIDLYPNQYAGPQRIKWMEDVLRRAGSAPLWICGEVGAGSTHIHAQEFFIQLLESWERIECISVVIHDREIPDAIQSRFLCRAPILKLFDVRLPSVHSPLFLHTLQPGSTECLFADYAPALVAIKAENVAFKLDSSWLHHIREIVPVPRQVTMRDIFALLQHTPHLENLSIDTTNTVIWTTDLHDYPKPTLPHLSSLKILTNLSLGGLILELFKPSSERLRGFGFSIWNSIRTGSIDPHTLSPFSRNLPVFISSFFTSNPPTTLLLILLPMGFRLHDLTKRSGEDFYFSILVNAGGSSDGEDVISCLLDAFTLPSVKEGEMVSIFDTVTEFLFRFRGIQSTLIPKLYSMLSIFHHVKDIQSNEASCQTLYDLFVQGEIGDHPRTVLFPQLHTLRLISRDPNDDKRYTGLMLFLIKRKDIGLPVAKLDLTICRKSSYGVNLRGLEEVDGLEVVWKLETGSEIFSYTCGAGHPELLDGLISD